VKFRLAALLGLVGLLAAATWSFGFLPLGCCGADCSACPPSFCKNSPQVVAFVLPSVELQPTGGVIAVLEAPRPETTPIDRTLSPGFLRPMRN
jgi:hypothetical protein